MLFDKIQNFEKMSFASFEKCSLVNVVVKI